MYFPGHRGNKLTGVIAPIEGDLDQREPQHEIIKYIRGLFGSLNLCRQGIFPDHEEIQSLAKKKGTKTLSLLVAPVTKSND